MKTKPKPKPKQRIKLPDGRIETWPCHLAYAIWLAIPGTKWIHDNSPS